jgi:hypothetical protein
VLHVLQALLPILKATRPALDPPTQLPTCPSPENETLTNRSTWGPCRTVPRSSAWSTRMIVICTCNHIMSDHSYSPPCT